MATLGVIGSSRKENEHRLPIHPDHFDLVPETLRGSIRFETGYGSGLGIDDAELGRRFDGVAPRRELLEQSGVVLLPKPLPRDLLELRESGVLWGWPHCVQQREITQAAIDRRQTLIAWEEMFVWKNGEREMHVFDRNNEMAGYCGVIHALGLTGKDGLYGGPAEACVLSHGSVSRGAIYALLGRGFRPIRVYTQRPPWAVHDKITGCRYGQLVPDAGRDGLAVIEEDGRSLPLIDVLGGADVIVNGILQDTDRPLMFLRPGEEGHLRVGALIVDVSCDLGMGFPFARPTSFEDPTFEVGRITYYAVDHTPSYLWRSASWELSRVVVPFLESVMGGPEAWKRDETVRRAIEIRDGVIQNAKILRFQNRAADYPHGSNP
jgi:alanine dehydrogenase